jgi:hypothetical protein
VTAPAVARPAKRRRWGLRTLGFLVLAMVALFTASAMGQYTIGTLGCLLIGLVGAGYSTVRGLRSLQRLEFAQRQPPDQDGRAE